MTRLMGDSTTAADIPQTFDMVAGYIDGIYQWSAADWLLFPGKPRVRIAIHATTLDGHVLDVEWGAASPQDIPAWLTARRAAGADPIVYVNRSNWQAAKDACAAAGVAEPHWWLAAYGTGPTLDAGLVAKQYANEALTGGHYDASVVADYVPGVDAMPIDPTELHNALNAPDPDYYNTIIAIKAALVAGHEALGALAAKDDAQIAIAVTKVGVALDQAAMLIEAAAAAKP